MDERVLSEIALKTGGAYVPAKTRTYDLAELYRTHIERLEKEEAVGKKRKRYRDQYQLFLLPALFFLLLDAGLAFYPRRNGRRRA